MERLKIFENQYYAQNLVQICTKNKRNRLFYIVFLYKTNSSIQGIDLYQLTKIIAMYESRLKTILIFCLFLAHISTYSLVGEWQLKNLNGEVSPLPITLNIHQCITTDTKIKYILQFTNCHPISYRVRVNDNVLMIDDYVVKEDSVTLSVGGLLQEVTAEQTICSNEQKAVEKKIADTLKMVFFFTIRDDLLVFISPQQKKGDLFEFQRVKKIYLTSLAGRWQLDKVFWQQATHSTVYFRPDTTTVTLCSGNITALYLTNHVNQLQFTNITVHYPCLNQPNITKAIEHIRYYRIKDSNELELYDEYSVETIEMFYLGELMDEDEKTKEGESDGGKVAIVKEEKVIMTSEEEKQADVNGTVVLVDFQGNKEQVTSVLQPYLRVNQETETKTIL